MSSHDRKLLEKELARFFGFDNVDDASDIFSSLLSIGSNDDLLEYLLALLGPSSSAADDIYRRTFVSNVQKWQLGDAIELNPQTASEEKELESVEQKYNVTKKDVKVKTTKPKQSRTVPNTTTSSSKISRNSKAHARETKRKKSTKPIKNTSASDVNPSSTNDNHKKEEQKKPAAIKSDSAEPKKTIHQSANIETTISFDECSLKISNLPKGKPETVCGCFGTFHKPLTNCLYCGRIACVNEGHGFCPYCNRALIDPNALHTIFGTINIELEEAIQHKNKILSFEIDSAKRTEVYDDEKDYFSNKTSAWLTKEEKFDSEQREELRRKELHQRKKALLQDFIALKVK